MLRRLRQRLGPRLDRLAKTVGNPTTQVYPSEYVGTVGRPIAELEAALSKGGFAWDPVSAYHYTPAGSSADGSWVYRSGPFGDRQLHVVLFAPDADRTDVYAHDEFNWLRHPVEHAREEDIRREQGSAEARRWLDARGIEYERDSRARRRLKHAIERVRARVGDRVGERRESTE
ncbi:hypothetical protein K933_14133 [Candidatus Halobonum tyrrellensis G22]|uniref:Uncharacterized protein n=1 Tax=Candidatus Halobonum tyrrellensis G22 TaxID=1324957 RepID=V4H9R0_9EURY|nr:hypothetical protein K933_14133 [Candidatus Halobonum tyrrellensis G22]